MKHLTRFILAVLGQTLGGLLLSALFIAVFFGGIFGVLWLLGNAVTYWTGYATPPPEVETPGTIALGMLPVMLVLGVCLIVKGVWETCKWLGKKWRETAQT